MTCGQDLESLGAPLWRAEGGAPREFSHLKVLLANGSRQQKLSAVEGLAVLAHLWPSDAKMILAAASKDPEPLVGAAVRRVLGMIQRQIGEGRR